MENPDRMTDIILEALSRCGARAIVSRGWSKLGSNHQKEDVLFIDDCPHGTHHRALKRVSNTHSNAVPEWLFKRVSAVVHHGGAGTTACGLLNGVPTAIVPFFGE